MKKGFVHGNVWRDLKASHPPPFRPPNSTENAAYPRTSSPTSISREVPGEGHVQGRASAPKGLETMILNPGRTQVPGVLASFQRAPTEPPLLVCKPPPGPSVTKGIVWK